MNVEKVKTDTYILTEIDRLDPVTVYVTNYKRGNGRIVIECYPQCANSERECFEKIIEAVKAAFSG